MQIVNWDLNTAENAIVYLFCVVNDCFSLIITF
jgi:hypothetical protein